VKEGKPLLAQLLCRGLHAAASATSNSMLACGTGRSAGHSGLSKQACAAWVSGQTPKLLLP
jgi:hypothetical protein